MRDHVKTINSAATHRDHSEHQLSHTLRVMSRHQYKQIRKSNQTHSALREAELRPRYLIKLMLAGRNRTNRSFSCIVLVGSTMYSEMSNSIYPGVTYIMDAFDSRVNITFVCFLCWYYLIISRLLQSSKCLNTLETLAQLQTALLEPNSAM